MMNLFDSKAKEYKRVRVMGMALMSKVGATIPVELMVKAAEDFKMLGKDGKIVIMDAEDEVGFIADRAIHDIPWPRKRWIETVCEQNSADYSPEEQALLNAHCQACFSLYEILGVESGLGLRLLDVFNKEEIFLTDLGLGATAKKGGLLATRIIRFEGIQFTSGVGMPFPAGDKEKLTQNFIWLFEKKKGVLTWEQLMRKHAPYFFIEYKKGTDQIAFADVVPRPKSA